MPKIWNSSSTETITVCVACLNWAKNGRIKTMNSTYLARCSFGLGVGLLLLSGWLGWQNYWDCQDAVVLQYDEKISAELSVGKETMLQAKLVNRKSRPARVLGLAPC
jgi:hypothetical protein